MILVTGSTGFVGHKILEICQDTIACPSLRSLTEDDIKHIVKESGADTIIHTAAISDIGICQENPEASFIANVMIPVYLARAAREAHIKLICFSSDQDMGDNFLDSVQGLKELKIFHADEAQHIKMNETSEEFRKITMKVLVMQLASTTIMDLVAYGGAGVGIAFAILGLVNRGQSPFAALFLILVAVDFFLPLRAFGSAFHIAMNGVSAGNKILSLLEQPDPIWGDEVVLDTTLKLENVSFSYDDKRDVLNNVTMEIPTYGMTSIVGESGCGKSTIVNMLCGAIRPKAGQVLVGGKVLERFSRESYYSHLAIVSYNTYIFNDTVRQNFMLSNKNVSDEEIYEALEKVNLADFIRNNGGLDKIITEDAANISGGQKQRLALAINLIANKDIYIFDEATSNIDIESEAIIMKNIKKLSKSKAVIVISHRLANVVPSDWIYYMEAGEIKETGTHLELMEKQGGYADLYTAQKDLEESYVEGTKHE